MAITDLYNIEEATARFNDALDFLNALSPLSMQMGTAKEIETDAFGVKEQFQTSVANPILDMLKTSQGVEAAKKAYTAKAEELSDIAQVTVMTVLYNAPEKSQQRHAMDLTEHCLRLADSETQQDFLIKEPFDFETIENGEFDPQRAGRLIAAADQDARNMIYDASEHEAFQHLALYAYDVTVSPKSPTIAVMKKGNEAHIPFDWIESDNLREHFINNEQKIRDTVQMLDPDLSEQLLDHLEQVYAENGFTFNREQESTRRGQELKDQIVGLSRDDYWTRFEQYAQAMQVVIEQNTLFPAPGTDSTLG